MSRYNIVEPVSLVNLPESNSKANSNKADKGCNNLKGQIACTLLKKNSLEIVTIQHEETSSIH